MKGHAVSSGRHLDEEDNVRASGASGRSLLDTKPWGWIVAGIATGAALLIRLALSQVFEHRAPFAFFIIAAFISAWYGGLWPGVGAVATGLVLGTWLFMTPQGSTVVFLEAGWVRIGSYLVVSVIAVMLLDALRKANRRADTANKLAETRGDELRTSTTEVQEAGARIRELAAIVESAQDAIFSETLDGKIRSWNPAAEHLFGNTRLEIIGQSASRLVPPERRDEREKTFERIRRGENVGAFETIGIAKDGRLLDLMISVSPLRDASGAVIGASTIARDISERKEAAEKIVRLNVELEERVRERTSALEALNRDLEAFNYSVSHDLRAPLRSISGFSNAVLEDYGDKLDERGVTYLKHAANASQRMALLIEDLMNLSRASRAEFHREDVDLSALAETIIADLCAGDPARAVNVTIAPGMTAQGDQGWLRIVLENLLSNAWKFTSHKPQATIEFGSLDKDGKKIYFVRDNGAGFDAAHARGLFGPFQRMHSSQEFPGTGIGLATVKRILMRSGGDVWAEATPNKGATFYFTLPSRSQTGHSNGD